MTMTIVDFGLFFSNSSLRLSQRHWYAMNLGVKVLITYEQYLVEFATLSG